MQHNHNDPDSEWDFNPEIVDEAQPNRETRRREARQRRLPGAPRQWMPYRLVRIYLTDRTPERRRRRTERVFGKPPHWDKAGFYMLREAELEEKRQVRLAKRRARRAA